MSLLKRVRAIRWFQFLSDFRKFRRIARGTSPRFELTWRDRYPCLDDATATTGFNHHYVLHPAWAARILARTRPETHVDISSTLTFCATVSAFLPIEFYDYRPAELPLENLKSSHADLLKLPFSSQSVKSLSCMHVVEHVGLGRYGDPLDYDGDLKAMAELQRVLAHGGHLLFVVPVSRPRIHFNAHRYYNRRQIESAFSELRLMEFSLITDRAELIRGADDALVEAQNDGCGCFWFVRG